MELKTFFAQDLMGNVIPSPTVTVYEPGTTTLVTGLQNSAGGALTNPFNGDGNGKVAVAAPDGDYDVKVDGAGRTTTMRVRFSDGGLLRDELASTAADKGASLIGNSLGGTAQDALDTVGHVATGMTLTEIDTAVASARAALGGVVSLPASGNLSGSTPLKLIGEFQNGLLLDGRRARITGTSDAQDGLVVGNEVGSIGSEYFNKTKVQDLSVIGPGKTGTAAGVHQRAGADVQLDNMRIRNWKVGLLLDGGLSSEFRNTTIRDCAIGVQAKPFTDGAGGLNDFSPNANSFYGLRLFYNDVAVDYDNNPAGVINWVGCNFEGNNLSGNNADGKAIVKFTQAGHVNMIGTHAETNNGQYGISYSGADASKALVMIGCEHIDTVGTNLRVEQGRFVSIGSRITNTGSPEDVSFAAGTSGTLLDTEAVISGDLSGVLALRSGRVGFGVQPVSSSPLIEAKPAAIAAALNIAASWQNDTVQLRWLNTAGTRVAYLQTSAAGNHTLWNDNASGGWAFGAGAATRFFVGRGGAANIEPGGDNTTTCGSGSLRWSIVYAATGTINTSDAREKQQTRELEDAERAVALRVKKLIRAFKWNDAVAEKGDGARWHFGVIAQDVMAAFEAEGLDPFAYGVVCHDKWEDGERYGVRYDQLFAMVLGVI